MTRNTAIAEQDYIYLIQTENHDLVQQLSDIVDEEGTQVFSIKSFGDLKKKPFQGEVVAFIIGSDVADPIQSAQRLYSINKNAKIALLSPTEKITENLKEAIRFSPFIGTNVTCLHENDWAHLGKILQESLQAVKYRAVIAETNKKISTIISSRKESYHQNFINKLMDITPVGIAIVSSQGKILGWNKEATSIFEKNESQVLGATFSNLFEHEEGNKLEEYFRKRINTAYGNGEGEALEVKREKQHNTNQILSITAARFEYSELDKNGLILVINDVTTHRESEQRLEKLNRSLEIQTKELAASNTELEQFAYVASHDLQEPLRMITSFLTKLEIKYDHLLDESAKKYIYFATDGAKRMKQIIHDLLEFSRIGRLEIEREDIDMNDLVQEALELNEILITEQKAVIEVEKLPEINAARGPMRQLFQNLINNAVKYQKKDSNPKVKITSNEDEEFWHFEVKDNGIGIKPEYSDKIFKIFQRLHRKEEYSGTGIGLAICQKIVENHGGKISVESEPGKGSTFYFTISKILPKI